MSKKQLAISTQLKLANEKVQKLEGELKSAINAKDSCYKNYADYQAQIEQVHQVLDSVPNSIPRKSDHEESWNRVERTILTRLAAWLAVRNMGA